MELFPPLMAIESLECGDEVRFQGVVYTARDAAHKRLVKLLEQGEELPFPAKGAVIYYVGPCPAKPGEIVGSAGPTTSSRMDDLTLPLLEAGIKGMIGKGERSEKVITGIKKHKAVYFAALGGAGALLARCIKHMELIAYPELGPEAVYKLEVVDFPAIVAIDARGRSIYQEGRKQYQAGGMLNG